MEFHTIEEEFLVYAHGAHDLGGDKARKYNGV